MLVNSSYQLYFTRDNFYPSALGLGADYTEHDADYRAHENFGVWPHNNPTSSTEFYWGEYLFGIYSFLK